MPDTTSATKRRVISAIATFVTFSLAGLVIGLFPRGNVVAQASSQSSVPVAVHIGNASGKGNSCKANSISHIFVTVKDIQAHRSGNGDSGFHDLTPGIPADGVQVDLLEAGSESNVLTDDSANECILTDVDGSTSGLPAGKYQQLRLFLATGGTSQSSACPDGGPNCVELNDMTFAPLTVPSGAIKIPSSQIAHGGLTITPGQGGVDLDIDINACASLVVRGGGNGHGHGHHGGGSATYALKPVLHSGEITLNPLIAGNVVLGDANDGTVAVAAPTTAIDGANVLLEDSPTSPNFVEATPEPSAGANPTITVDRQLASTFTDANGHFVFCPVPAGNYNIVVAAETMPSSVPTPSNGSDATITTGVSVANNGGPTGLVIPLLPASSAPVTLNAQFTSQDPSSHATPATIDFGPAQTAAANVGAEIPIFSGSSANPAITVSNGCSSKCPSDTDCECVSLVVPEDNPVVGAAGGSYSSPAAAPALYSVFGVSTNSPANPVCNPTNLVSDPHASPLPTPTLSFVDCH
jgi:hypothetical protein